MVRRRKRVLHPGGKALPTGSGTEFSSERPAPAPIIREIPTSRTIEFYGERLVFVPENGTLWLSVSGTSDALCLEPHQSEHSSLLRHGKRLLLHDHAFSERKRGPFVSICYVRIIALQLSLVAVRDEQFTRANRLLDVLQMLQRQNSSYVPVHTHTLPRDSEPLRQALEAHPQWEEIITLWNIGKTEGEIVKVVPLTVNQVKGALVAMERQGFDVLRGVARSEQKWSDGRRRSVPQVRGFVIRSINFRDVS